MNEETSSSNKSWLDSLAHALLREPKDREQLLELLRDAEQRELLDTDALHMIEGVLEVSELKARDIMVPRKQMVVVESDQTPEEFLPIITESGHSRFPVVGENRDEVIGLLLAKDLLKYAFNGKVKTFIMKDVLRRVRFIPESMRVDVLLKEFRINRNHIAIVADEYGGVAGLVTIEDILEQIVGDIVDEYDANEGVNIQKQLNGDFLLKSLTPIEEFNEFFQTDFDEEEFDTIGGLVAKHFGRLAKRGETIIINDFEFKIISADSRRLRLLQAKRI